RRRSPCSRWRCRRGCRCCCRGGSRRAQRRPARARSPRWRAGTGSNGARAKPNASPYSGPVSREGLRAVNDNGAKVVHVGTGRAGLNEIAEPAEKAGGIVVGEEGGGIEAKRAGAGQGGRI